MQMRNKRFMAWLLVVSMFISMFSTGLGLSYADGADSAPKGYVTISVEKFTLGRGYIKEPVKVPFYDGDNGALMLTRLLGEGNYRNTGSTESAFYLSKIKNNDISVNVPQYILDQSGPVQSLNDNNWLGEFDYTFMSGWMYTVNNEFLGYGFSDYFPQDGDVIRTQFTVFGYGSDLRNLEEGGFIDTANKDALTARVAEINSDYNKTHILSNKLIRATYDHAYTVLGDMESTQERVESALIDLNNAIENSAKEDTEPPVIAVKGLYDNQEVSDRELSFKVTVTDNVYDDIIPEVKLNGAMISLTDKEYKVTLNDGDNIIVVTAIDSAGNKAEKTYVISYKVLPPNIAKEQLDKSLAYIFKNVTNPTFGTGNGEWSILSLARANYTVPSSYYNTYYNNVVSSVKELMENGKLDATKSTETSRLILGLTSIGKDINSVGRYDIKNALADFDYLKVQGNNGPIFALIALDSYNYEIPVVEEGKVQTTREKLVKYILDNEVKKDTADAGGWALGNTKADVDMTAMAMQALAKYYDTNNEVKEAVDRAIKWLSSTQNSTGGFTSWGSTSSESISQVIVALTGVGIDPHTDGKFIKNGKSLIDALLSFSVPEGGFKHILTGKVDRMATDQGTYALVAYDRLIKGENRLFDMTDVLVKPNEPRKEVSLPPGDDKPKVDIPQDELEYNIPINLGDSNKEISIVIPEDKNSTVSINVPMNSGLPQLEAVKGKVSVVIPKDTKVTRGDASVIELISSKDTTDTLTNKINKLIPRGKNLDIIVQAFSMGGNERVEFSQFVTLTFAGMSGMDAAYIQNGKPSSIQRFASDIEGLNSGKNEYAYDRGNDLIVKTKHFTDFVAYASSEIVEPDGGDGSQQSVTLSVDKDTIKKGDVIKATRVVLRSGDTAWSVLKRELDKRSISYDSSWSGKYGSIYVESIAGDGEFDHGSGSGWMYNVNGWYPNYGASSYTLRDGDTLQWRYTTDLGADLGVDLSKYEPISNGQISVGQGIIIRSDDKTPVINVPKDIQKDYTLNIPKELKNTTNISINIPDVKPRVFLNLVDVIGGIPMINITKGNISVVIDKGTQLKSGDPKIELMTSIDANTTQIQERIKESLKDNDKLEKLIHAFIMGNPTNSVLFDKPLTFAIKSGKGQLPGFIDNNKFTPIEIYETEEKGAQATKGNTKQTYAYVKGNDLYIKSNHFTTFVSYTVSKASEINKNDVANTTDLNKIYTDADAISSWAITAIGEATRNGFIQGSNGKFNPKSNITRAEFTKILVTVLGLDTTLANGASFKDVRANDWFYPYVNAANKAGLITGYNNEFHPNDNITREQMAVTIVRALGIQESKSGAAIKDINKASAWAKKDIETVTALGLMTGSGSLFNPKDVVTREMAAVVSTRVHNYKNDHKTTDNNTGKVDIVDSATKLEVQTQIKDTAAFMQKAVTDPVIASVGGDWTIFGLARSDVPVPDAYYAKYYANVEKILKEKSGKLHNVKYTEYDRVILALTSMGRNIDDVAGYNLREPLADFDTLIKQGINGPIFALIALDSKHYEIPIVTGVKTQTTRELLVDYILNREISGGGWALGEKPDVSDADVTSMAIQGLAPYFETNSKVKAAVDRGVAWLSKAQTADGGYTSWGSVNSESIAQVVVAVSSLGIDADRDARFIKNGKSPLDALLSFAAPSGGFYHIKSGGQDNGGAKPGEIDLMATDQAMYALVAYDRYINKQTRLYDMSDVK